MSKPFTLYLIHHSHTDIGYTDLQGRILRRHTHYLRRAMDICGRRPDFRWQCETFWPVEQAFYDFEEQEWERLGEFIQSGQIGLSASALNFSELASEDLIQALLDRHAIFAELLGTTMRSAMTADINGVGRGWAKAMLDHGVENYFTCIHTHHGMYPLGRTQTPFWWEMPDGRRLLTWNGEHYHLGNEMGLAPDACASYLTKDECDADAIYTDWWRVAETRIRRYRDQLVDRGYPYDFAPLMISGLRTDNGPPSEAILDAVERWNAAHGHDVRVEMTTLDPFFERLRNDPAEIPVHTGDWPDWWSDGPSGDAQAVRLYRAALRDWRRWKGLRKLIDDPGPPNDAGLIDDLALFAEHTFSHSDAMSRPWHELVHAIGGRKRGYAAAARDKAQALVDEACEMLGGCDMDHGMGLTWRTINPGDAPLQDLARMTLGHYEFRDRKLERGFRVLDPDGRELPFQLDPVPLGVDVCVQVELEPGEMRNLRIVPDETAGPSETYPAPDAPAPRTIGTDHVTISWRPGQGIVRWETADGRDLLDPNRDHAPFTLVHQITPVPNRESICSVRGAMGLDRRGPDARTTAMEILGGRLVNDGPLFTEIELFAEMPGCTHGELMVRVMKGMPKVEAALRFHAQGRWEPENYYAALPFSAGPGAELILDRAGWPLRPWGDQVPGTLCDYYSVLEGWGSVGDGYSILVGMKDGALVQLGNLSPGERALAGSERLKAMAPRSYAWLMTNYWETNFQAHLGGFHEFRFSIEWGDTNSKWIGDQFRAAITTTRYSPLVPLPLTHRLHPRNRELEQT